jgi:hypothetical protein
MLTRRSVLGILACLALGVAAAHAADDYETVLLWAKGAGGPGIDVTYDVAALPDGGAYLIGYFYSPATITLGAGEVNETTLVSSGATDMFLARYNADGTLAWALKEGGSGDDQPRSVVATSDGGALVAGNFYATCVFARGLPEQMTLGNTGNADQFLARYDAEGTLLWARRAGGSGLDVNNGVDALPSDRALVSGAYGASAIFGPGETIQTTMPATPGAFVARYAADGDLNWAVPIPGADNCYVRRMIDGDMIVAGNFSGSMTLGYGDANEIDLTAPSGGTDMYLARLDSQGHLVWAKQAGGLGGVFLLRATNAHIDDSAIVSGNFSGSATFGAGEPNETSVSSVGGEDAFLARFGPDGELLWIRRAGGTGYDLGMDVTARSDGGAFLTGAFSDTATFGLNDLNETTLVAAGGTDIYFAVYRPDGTLESVCREGGDGDDISYAVSTDAGGRIITSGMFANTATFGLGQPNESVLTAGGVNDIVMVKYLFTPVLPNAADSGAWVRYK